jgi:hypothetical protein
MQIEQRLARAEAILGAQCETCPHRRVADMPTEELHRVIDDETEKRLEALSDEELAARLPRLWARMGARRVLV